MTEEGKEPPKVPEMSIFAKIMDFKLKRDAGKLSEAEIEEGKKKHLEASFVHEDDVCVAIHDAFPVVDTSADGAAHLLVIPRKQITQLSKADSEDKAILGHCLYVAGQLGRDMCPRGFRIVINDGKEGCQSVYHLHVHVIGGRQLIWPPA